ncbi:MAG: response regulator [Verrucomicrobiota bacterium]
MPSYCDKEIRVLLFEDNPADAHLVAEYFESSDLKVKCTDVKRLVDGLKALEDESFDLILLDLSLPDSQGISTLKLVTAHLKNEVVIVLTGDDDQQLSLDALKAGAQDYLNKDRLNSEILTRSINYAMERSQLVQSVEAHAREAANREGFLRRVFDATIDSMLILSESHEIKFLNRSASVLLEADVDSLIGETFPFEVADERQHIELEVPGPGDSTRIVDLNAINLIWKGEKAILVVMRDMTRRRRAEAELRHEKERLAVMLDTISDAVIATDSDGCIERLNQEAERLTGFKYEEVVGEPLGKVLKFRHPGTGACISDPSQLLLTEDRTNLGADLGIPLICKDESELFVSAEMRCILDDNSGNHGCVVVIRDVTNQKRAEDERFQSEKLRSISLLAGGIAHDFNNILTAVVGNISVARMDVDETDKVAPRLEAAEKAALQARSLTQQLLTFSKGESLALAATTIDELVEDSVLFMLRGSNVKCEIEKDDSLWAVEADQGQISQVVNNLTINADQAMPNGGVISIKLSNVQVNTNEIRSLKSGSYVCLRVKDQGTGISPDNIKRIFDPYFTTKQEGNGLGLASSYSIVQRHGGTMTVESVPGEGATFKVYLPRTTKPVVKAKEEKVEEATEIQSGSGRILVMDDMEAMMLVAGEILKVLGYEVDFSTNGQEAIDLYKKAKEAGNPFDAVVFDLTVPGGMGGEEACKILRQYDPSLIAIASSGYTTSNVMSDYQGAGFKAVVPKPYRIKEMSAALQRILK